jgi:hypothetical protein
MRTFLGFRAFFLGLALVGGFTAAEGARAEMVMVANYVPMERKLSRVNPIRNGDTVCSQEVKSCPDGSYVGRNPADECKFKPCPGSAALN